MIKKIVSVDLEGDLVELQNNGLNGTISPLGEKDDMYYDKERKQYVANVPTGERYPNGRMKYKRAYFDTEIEALMAERNMYVELQAIKAKLDQLLPDKKTCSRLFKDVAEEWINRRLTEPSKFSKKILSPTTWSRYNEIIQTHLIPLFGDRPIDTITEMEIGAHLRTRTSSSDMRQHFFVLRNIFRMVELDTMEKMTIPRLEKHREINCITDPDELQAFIDDLEDTDIYYPTMLAATTGLSMSELAGLRWSDINFKRKRLTVNRSLHWVSDEELTRNKPNNRKKKGRKKEYYWITKDTKRSSRRRTISIDSFTAQKLAELKEKTNGTNDDFVFKYKNMPLNGIEVAKLFRKEADKLGYYGLTMHGLRHSHATILIMVYKMDPKTVSRRLGHADVSITLREYSAFLPQNDEQCAEIMEDILSKKIDLPADEDEEEALY